MTADIQKSAPHKYAPTGFLFLALVTIGSGINWPVQKLLLNEWPPLSARSLSGLIGTLVLAVLALIVSQSLRMPRELFWRALVSGFLNITLWLVMMGYALTILPASEAAIIAYTMPVWTVLLSWPFLGERPKAIRMVALAMAFGGIVALLGGNTGEASLAKLPGYALGLGAAVTYALGTIFLKRYPIPVPPITSAAWQLGLGCLPVAIVGVAFERPEVTALSVVGWSAFVYNATVQQCFGYLCWLAALHRLPASIASIGTMFTPVIGVLASAYVLGEPLGPAQIAALALTLGGVLLAVRT